MKNLIILRHAKSSWKDLSINDFNRPLNKRGKRDAPFMGELLRKKEFIPESIFCSPAKRAFTTAIIVAEKLGVDETLIITKQSIYESDLLNLLSIIKNFPNKEETIMIVGHNPALTALSNYLSDKYVDTIPTCGAISIQLEIEKWEETKENIGKIILAEYPKKYFK